MPQSIPHSFDLASLNISRPEKVLWRFEYDGSSILNSIPSKSLRKFFAKSDEILKENSIVFESKEISEEEYIAWLPYYEKKMLDNNYDIIADVNWFNKKRENGDVVKKLSFLRNGEQLTTGIIAVKKNQVASLAFKAGDRVSISSLSNSSLGTLLDYFFLTEAINLGCTNIFGGSSRNAFGVINKFSYLEFKMRNGYTAIQIPEAKQFDTVPLDESGEAMFFGLQQGNWGLYHTHPEKIANIYLPGIQGYYSKQIFDLTY